MHCETCKMCLNKKSNSHKIFRGWITITPEMIRAAVKLLQTRRESVTVKLMEEHFRLNYPIRSDPNEFRKELMDKLDCAVHAGLIINKGNDEYCLPTFRQQAMSQKATLTTFWDKYYKGKLPNRRKNSKRKRIRRNRKDSSVHRSQGTSQGNCSLCAQGNELPRQCSVKGKD